MSPHQGPASESGGAGPANRRSQLFTRALQIGIGGCLVAGLAVGNIAIVVNAGLGLAATYIPAILERDRGLLLGPRYSIWISGAVLLHTIGMLGLYGDTGWWDHLTHTVSAALIASVGYAAARAIDAHIPEIELPQVFLVVFVFLFTLALGVLWEVTEFLGRAIASTIGADPVLKQFGVGDTMLDLVFDGAGALLVAGYRSHRSNLLEDRLGQWLRGTRPGDLD